MIEKRFVYADNAATTELDKKAYEAMCDYLCNDYSNPSQPYSFSRNSKKVISEAREIIAKCINAQPEQIIFTSGGTESNNAVIRSFPNNSVICSSIEHHSVLNVVKQNNEQFDKMLDVTSEGIVNISSLKSLVLDKIKLVSVMHVNNELGTIQPVNEISEICHSKNVQFHTDAVQAIGHIKVDVKETNMDFLSASAHKFNGPKGIGFLYVKDIEQWKPFIVGGHQENGCRAGTENVASIVGMAVALKHNCEEMENSVYKIKKIESEFINRISKLGINYHINSLSKHTPGLINISFPEILGEALLHRLDLLGICVSTGSACNGSSTDISHVLKAINLPIDYAKSAIRISFGKNNSIDDAVYLVDSISKIVADT